MEAEIRHCPECGREIKGRRDKKFCDDTCRNTFNNKHYSDQTPEMRNINNALRKNRRIMEELLPPEGKIKIAGKVLREKGFDVNYITQIHTTQTGSVYRYCYEFGYLPLEGDYFLLVKKEKKS
jgi:hypothetical protein